MSKASRGSHRGEDWSASASPSGAPRGLNEKGEGPFIYDEPAKYLYRLFQLDMLEDGSDVGEDAPLTGSLMSCTFDKGMNVYKTLMASIREDSEDVMEALSGKREYVAVSYCWGAAPSFEPLYLKTISCSLDDDSKVVTCHDPERHGYVWITPNAKSFLLEMRKQKEKSFMWIDAICIDQSSEQDKANQISRMNEIYEHAEMVYVWLGMASEAEKMALRMMSNVTAKLKRCRPIKHDSLESAFDEAGLPEPKHSVWASYASILTKDWWSRLWTYQEVTMATAPKDAVQYKSFYKAPYAFVWCSEIKTAWEQFDHFAEALAESSLRSWLITGQEGVVWDHLHGLDAISEVRTGRESSLRYGWGQSLSALLVATRRRAAKEPADMVWGMYSLIAPASRKELALERSMPASEVFVRFAKHYIRNEVKECILNHTATLEKLSDLPTWCPNFASHEESASIGTRWYGHYQERPWLKAQMPRAGFQKKGKWSLPRSKLYYARYIINSASGKHSLQGLYSTDNPRQIALVPNTNAILTSGIHLDVITDVVPCNDGAESAYFLSYNSIQQTCIWDQACFSVAQRCLTTESPDSSSKSKYDLYARTLTANRVAPSFTESLGRSDSGAEGRENGSSDSEDEGDPEIVFDRKGEVDFATPYLSFRKFMQATLDVGESIPAKGNLDPAAQKFSQCLHLMSKRRRFFGTKGGRIGMGPSEARPGDKIVVIFYCPTPYLIRAVEGQANKWQFVGEAYVNGFMYGEALQMFDEGKVRETKWTIV